MRGRPGLGPRAEHMPCLPPLSLQAPGGIVSPSLILAAKASSAVFIYTKASARIKHPCKIQFPQNLFWSLGLRWSR